MFEHKVRAPALWSGVVGVLKRRAYVHPTIMVSVVPQSIDALARSHRAIEYTIASESRDTHAEAPRTIDGFLVSTMKPVSHPQVEKIGPVIY